MKYKLIILPVITFLVLGCGEIENKEKDIQEIKLAIENAEKNWNNGDLWMFMDIYWNSSEVRFISKRGIVYGIDNIYEHFKKKYETKDTMGEISFKLLDIKRIDRNLYSVTGKYNLISKIKVRDGIYTLVFKKIDEKWVVVSDHTN